MKYQFRLQTKSEAYVFYATPVHLKLNSNTFPLPKKLRITGEQDTRYAPGFFPPSMANNRHLIENLLLPC